jgi:formate dehydrogenase major subunit
LAKLVATKYTAPDEVPDAEYPFILTTGRQLEHWHTGAMTRRASVLDALEPGPIAQLSRGTIAKLGIKPGDMVRVTTRRGVSNLRAPGRRGAGRRGVHPVRLCRGGGEPAHQSEARSVRQNPEFKFCAAKVEAVEPQREAAE